MMLALFDKMTGECLRCGGSKENCLADPRVISGQAVVVECQEPDSGGSFPHRVVQSIIREPVLQDLVQVGTRILSRGPILRSGADVKIENPQTEAFMEPEDWPPTEKAKQKKFDALRPIFDASFNVTSWREMDAAEKAARDVRRAQETERARALNRAERIGVVAA